MGTVPPDLNDVITWMLGGPPPMKIHSSTSVVGDEPPLLEDYVLGGPPPSEIHENAAFQMDNVHVEYVETLSDWISLCGYFATLSSILVNLSLIPIILQIKRNKSVGSMPLLPFSIMAVSSFAWLLYGEFMRLNITYLLETTVFVFCDLLKYLYEFFYNAKQVS